MVTLKNSEIHLWYADQADFNDDELESLILHWLTADEKNRYQRYYFDRQRNQFLLSRMVVRSVLSLAIAVCRRPLGSLMKILTVNLQSIHLNSNVRCFLIFRIPVVE